MISCVGNDNDLKDIYLSKNGIITGIKSNTIIIDHTTASPEISKKLYKIFLQKKSFFFDAPMSGGEIGAKNGKLSLMVGGDHKKFKILQSNLNIYSKSIVYMGKIGNGQLTKTITE